MAHVEPILPEGTVLACGWLRDRTATDLSTICGRGARQVMITTRAARRHSRWVHLMSRMPVCDEHADMARQLA